MIVEIGLQSARSGPSRIVWANLALKLRVGRPDVGCMAVLVLVLVLEMILALWLSRKHRTAMPIVNHGLEVKKGFSISYIKFKRYLKVRYLLYARCVTIHTVTLSLAESENWYTVLL